MVQGGVVDAMGVEEGDKVGAGEHETVSSRFDAEAAPR